MCWGRSGGGLGCRSGGCYRSRGAGRSRFNGAHHGADGYFRTSGDRNVQHAGHFGGEVGGNFVRIQSQQQISRRDEIAVSFVPSGNEGGRNRFAYGWDLDVCHGKWMRMRKAIIKAAFLPVSSVGAARFSFSVIDFLR